MKNVWKRQICYSQIQFFIAILHRNLRKCFFFRHLSFTFHIKNIKSLVLRFKNTLQFNVFGPTLLVDPIFSGLITLGLRVKKRVKSSWVYLKKGSNLGSGQ